MAIHYKKRKWYEKVDPTFNEIIFEIKLDGVTH
jgi:hypothetical protein